MFSRNNYDGDGSNKVFPIAFPYLSIEHVGLMVDGITYSWGTEFIADQVNNTITVADNIAAPPVGTGNVTIYRATPRTDSGRIVQWTDGGGFNETNLNLSDLQLLYIMQEILDHQEILDAALAAGGGPGGVGATNFGSTYFSPTAPVGSIPVGAIWFNQAENNKIYRWDGVDWIDVQKSLDEGDFGPNVRPIRVLGSLPAVGDPNELVQVDGVLYQWDDVAEAWIPAPELAANSITALHIGANEVITQSANIKNAIINDAHIANLAAGKILTGDLVTVNLAVAGRRYDPNFPGEKFHEVEPFGGGGITHTWPAVADFSDGAWVHVTTPVTFKGQGILGGFKTYVRNDGTAWFSYSGAVNGYTGNICGYYEVNDDGTFVPFHATSSDDGGKAVINGFRKISGLSPTDYIKFYIAPCDGNGTILAPVGPVLWTLEVISYNLS